MSIQGRRGVLVCVVLLIALLAAAAVGRWERDRNARRQNDRMAALFHLATADGLVSRRLDRYRLDAGFDCLGYHPIGKPKEAAAYEICFDSRGRLVQTIDRSGGTAVFGSLLEQPSLATTRVPVPTLLSLFRRTGVLRAAGIRGAGRDGLLPTVQFDTGAIPFPRPPRGS